MNRIKRKWRKWFVIPLAVVLVAGTVMGVQMTRQPETVYASGVEATNVTLTGQDKAGHYTFVQFDIGWEYSWRDAENWDAAWIFVKYKESGGDWAHATLDTSGHSVTTDNGLAVTIDVGLNEAETAGLGVFLHRSGTGASSIDWDGVKLKWLYGTDGLLDDAIVTVKVFAIEMVYIPTGGFDIGDGNGTDESNYAFHVTDNTKVNITTSLTGSIKVDANSFDDDQIELTGIGIDGDGGLDTDNNGTIDNADFPTGYKAFYVMKYEISQRQYAEFLNTLTSTQASNRYPGQSSNRHYIEVQDGVYGCDANNNDTLNESNDGGWTACNYISWADGATYADWAGLRPMTELEYEKMCRGPVAAVYDEYAWGNTNIASTAYTLDSAQQAGEVIATNYADDPIGNASYAITDGSIDGPLRVGIFATASSTRAEAGASYYGVMELSGNLQERVVTVGNSTGRAFTGIHGDGSLDASGGANVSNWPGTDALGAGIRGGGSGLNEVYLRVSDRIVAAAPYSIPDSANGFRLVRTP